MNICGIDQPGGVVAYDLIVILLLGDFDRYLWVFDVCFVGIPPFFILLILFYPFLCGIHATADIQLIPHSLCLCFASCTCFMKFLADFLRLCIMARAVGMICIWHRWLPLLFVTSSSAHFSWIGFTKLLQIFFA